MSALRILIVLALVAGCGAPARSTPPRNTGGTPGGHEPMASIARGACYGTCPQYTVQVYRDGALEYEGEQFVKLTGKHTGQVTPAQLAAIDRLFVESGYLDMKDAYQHTDWTDMPTVMTSYAGGGRSKAIVHYHGDESAPSELGRVEDQLDGILKIEQWIGTRAERDELR